ncbi:MAG: hypothetical protein PHF95_06480, partial [bacterium]|nr:hypothetical protein [bacterium]
MIDAIAAWRDAGLCQPVTLNAFFAGYPRGVTGYTGVLNGDLDSAAALATAEGLSGGGSGTTLEAAGGNPGKCIRIPGSEGAVYFDVVDSVPGASHIIELDAVKTTAAVTRMGIWVLLKDAEGTSYT